MDTDTVRDSLSAETLAKVIRDALYELRLYSVATELYEGGELRHVAHAVLQALAPATLGAGTASEVESDRETARGLAIAALAHSSVKVMTEKIAQALAAERAAAFSAGEATALKRAAQVAHEWECSADGYHRCDLPQAIAQEIRAMIPAPERAAKETN